MTEQEDKPYYKIGEVCELTSTQPYVLRFWESEFPTLAPQKNRSGQRIYRKRDIDLIQRIKTLLYEKEYTIAGARKVLESDSDDKPSIPSDARPAGEAPTPVEKRAIGAEHHSHERKAVGAGRDRGLPEATSGDRKLPFQSREGSDLQIEAEIKNLRAKLARAEAELKAILEAMDRHDES